VVHDLRAALRSIRCSPGLSIAIIVTAALGIGANTAVFSVVDAVLLQPPPYPHGERLTEIWEAYSGQRLPVSWTNLQQWRHEAHSFDGMAGFETAEFTLTGRGDAALIRAGAVSSDFFRLMGWESLQGRLLNEGDDAVGAAPVVLVTGEFITRRLNNDSQSIGSTIVLDGTAYQIVGILPSGLRFFTEQVDIYVPSGPRNGSLKNRDEHGSMVVLGLLRSGTRRTDAEEEVNALMSRPEISARERANDHRSSVVWLGEVGSNDIRLTMFALLGAVALVLVIACANIAGLLLLRGTTRTREAAIRSAIGATRFQLARQLLAESSFVVATGGAVGLVLARLCLPFLLLAAPQDIPRLWDSRLNMPVFVFAAAIAALTGLLAGLAPVFEIRGIDVSAALKDSTPGAGVGKRGLTLRSCLIVMEIALALILTFGGGLLFESLRAAQTHDPGFQADRVLALELQLPQSSYKTGQAVRAFYSHLLQNLRQISGVESVGAVNCPPSTGGCAKGWYSIAGMPDPQRDDVPLTLLTTVDAEYFRTIGMHLLAGRSLTSADRDHHQSVVVNETLARRWWPHEPRLAVGQRIKFGGPYLEGPNAEIVGVVADVTQSALDVKSFSEVYVVDTARNMVVMVRAGADPAHLIPAVRRELVALDRGLPAVSVVPFSARMEATLKRRRFNTVLAEVFAVIAMALTALGIYSIFNYWVRTRQKELAIRIALGASPSEISQLMGGHMFRIAILGITLGVFGCWVTSRWLKSLVYGISEQNPLVLLAASALVITVAAVAAIPSIWRATRVDPVRHLHDS
jgi:putative ABC transport system permease protein